MARWGGGCRGGIVLATQRRQLKKCWQEGRVGVLDAGSMPLGWTNVTGAAGKQAGGARGGGALEGGGWCRGPFL